MASRQPSGRVRFAVVGGGWISQAAFMPGVAQAGNAAMTALVTGDPNKAKALAQRYGLATYGYGQYEAAIANPEVDAIYLALPNDMHRDYAVPALEAGVHLLLEKPMATSEEDCREIIAAAERSGAKLMIAYRLHFDPTTLEAIRLVGEGAIGEPRCFTSMFSQPVSRTNHRASNGFWAGPVADMGPYPINAARNLFAAEPIEVFAAGTRSGDLPGDFHDAVAVTLRFPQDRIAQFTVAYGPNNVDRYQIVGTKGDVEVLHGFGFPDAKTLRHTVGEKTDERSFPASDQFGAETRYFCDCVLNGRDPAPDGAEGLADVRVVAAVERALAEGRPQTLAPLAAHARLSPRQEVRLPPIEVPELVDAAAPGEG